MTNLTDIVRATRKSALAIARSQRHARTIKDNVSLASVHAAAIALARANADYARAQAVLRANPLPGDDR